MLVRRKVKNSRIVILGRKYLIPEYRQQEAEGKEVFAEDDGVIRQDIPKWGLHTKSTVCIKYPGRYDFFTYAQLDEE
jgi:hypothetical protein